MTDEIDVIAKEERRKVDKGETEEIIKKYGKEKRNTNI